MTRINHNIASMINQGYLNRHDAAGEKILARLSTGYRINKAADDQPGLSASEKLRAQIRGSMQAQRNSSDGIAMLNIAEGAASEVTNILQRMRELCVQSSSDSLTSSDRSSLNQEFVALKDEIDRLCYSTNYNGQTLIAGGLRSFGSVGGLSSVLHIGANTSSVVDRIKVRIDPITVGALHLSQIALTNHQGSMLNIGRIDEALRSVNLMRTGLGAVVNRLETNLTTMEYLNAHMQSAESNIRDLDFASESTEFTKNQILQQSSTAMLGQANSLPERILALFGAK